MHEVQVESRNGEDAVHEEVMPQRIVDDQCPVGLIDNGTGEDGGVGLGGEVVQKLQVEEVVRGEENRVLEWRMCGGCWVWWWG